ncbi:MAG: DedA family protein [Massilibacteroides sp.]|nr:DedA family protein [Massilibacteroides sp.]
MVKMQEFIIGFLNQHGYFGVGLLMAIENIFPPIPSEIILTFSGFMTTKSSMKIWGVILSATIGSLVGALLLYLIGKMVPIEYLKKLLDGKVGQSLRLRPNDIRKAGGWFAKRGNITVFFCRFVPIVRSLISIPAGTANMNLGMFLLLTTLGTAMWNTLLVWLGVFAGESWGKIVSIVGVYSTFAIAVMGIVVLFFMVIFFKRRFKKN